VAVDPGCTFCRIVAGQLPSYRVFEDDIAVAFLDHRPLRPGHCLLVPREHVETLHDAPPELVAALAVATQRLSRAAERALGADGAFVAINVRVSQSVPHLHTHIVPRHRKDGLFGKNLLWLRRPYPDEQAIASVQAAIVAALAADMPQ
jgi:histidine triad (HIT) family protein